MEPWGIPSVHGSVDEVTVPNRSYCDRLDRKCNIQYVPVEKHAGVRCCAGEFCGPRYYVYLSSS